MLSSVVLPACVPPATTMLSPATTQASRKSAACGVSVPRSTRWCSRLALITNLRMLTALKPRLIPSSTTCRRCPDGSIASTNGVLTSTRRPDVLSIRSTRSRTSAVVRIVVVSSCRPSRATNTRCGSLIQISSTVGSSRYGCSGPKPATLATSSSTAPSGSSIGRTMPDRLRWSWSRTAVWANRRTAATSVSGSTPWRRTSSRTSASRASSADTPLTRAAGWVRAMANLGARRLVLRHSSPVGHPISRPFARSVDNLSSQRPRPPSDVPSAPPSTTTSCNGGAITSRLQDVAGADGAG